MASVNPSALRARGVAERVTFIDTADVYASHPNEELIREALYPSPIRASGTTLHLRQASPLRARLIRRSPHGFASQGCPEPHTIDVVPNETPPVVTSRAASCAPHEAPSLTSSTRAVAATALGGELAELGLFIQTVRDYAIFMLDARGHVRTWNPGAENIKGYKREEIVGKHFSTFYPPEDVAAGKPDMELRVATAEGRFEDEGWRVRKDGSHFWANVVITAVRDDAGNLVGFGKVTRDLTERRLAEQKLRQSEERLRLLLLSVSDYAIYMLDPSGLVTSWNPGVEVAMGYGADEIIGKHFSTFYPPEEAATGKPARELAVARTEGRYEEEGVRVRKDGTRFLASVVLTAMRDASGALVGFAKVTRDLTERKRAEDERLRLAHAQEALRLRDEFLAVASHELRTPLTSLTFQLEELGRLSEPYERAAMQLERCTRSCARLVALVDTLLDVARITAGKLRLTRERFEIGAALREVVYRLGEEARKAGSTMTIREKRSIEGSWDRLRIEQLFASLLGNAIKYGGGTPIDVAIDHEDQAVKIMISDHGPGIAAEALVRIFQRFERAAPAEHNGGLGLGLYISRQIVEAHGGTIEVASTPDAGATFVVRLPTGDAA